MAVCSFLLKKALVSQYRKTDTNCSLLTTRYGKPLLNVWTDAWISRSIDRPCRR